MKKKKIVGDDSKQKPVVSGSPTTVTKHKNMPKEKKDGSQSEGLGHLFSKTQKRRYTQKLKQEERKNKENENRQNTFVEKEVTSKEVKKKTKKEKKKKSMTDGNHKSTNVEEVSAEKVKTNEEVKKKKKHKKLKQTTSEAVNKQEIDSKSKGKTRTKNKYSDIAAKRQEEKHQLYDRKREVEEVSPPSDMLRLSVGKQGKKQKHKRAIGNHKNGESSNDFIEKTGRKRKRKQSGGNDKESSDAGEENEVSSPAKKKKQGKREMTVTSQLVKTRVDGKISGDKQVKKTKKKAGRDQTSKFDVDKIREILFSEKDLTEENIPSPKSTTVSDSLGQNVNKRKDDGKNSDSTGKKSEHTKTVEGVNPAEKKSSSQLLKEKNMEKLRGARFR